MKCEIDALIQHAQAGEQIDLREADIDTVDKYIYLMDVPIGCERVMHGVVLKCSELGGHEMITLLNVSNDGSKCVLRHYNKKKELKKLRDCKRKKEIEKAIEEEVLSEF